MYPKISIITPSFNQDQYLEATILSVLEQNYPNLEYMIIDGGSTDQSVEIIKKYQEHLTYWVSEKDRGQTHAINKGFKRATGDVVNWLNSSYMLPKESLWRLAEAINSNPKADVYYGDYQAVDETGKPVYTRKMGPYMYPALFWGRQLSSQPAVFIRRHLFEQLGYLDEEKVFCMDTEFWIRVSRAGTQFQQVKHPLGITRSHPTAKTTRLQHVLHDEHKAVVRRYHALDVFKTGGKAENAYFTFMNRFWRMAAALNRMLFRGDFSIMQATQTRKSVTQEN